jgi:hypothetical protein
MPLEPHPYLHHFDGTIKWKNLIIGTFPPKLDCEKRKNLFPYFYGNRNTIWQILKETNLYPDYNFNSIENIKFWQKTYSVGVTDVLKQCRRKAGKECSPADTHLVIDYDNDLNTSLKNYILHNVKFINKIYFTSGSLVEKSNSAFFLFIKLMGDDLKQIAQDKLVLLPAPSNEFLRSVFIHSNLNFGLKEPFFTYLKDNHPEALDVAGATFNLKSKTPKTRINSKGKVVNNIIERFPDCPSYPSLFRNDLYRGLMPTTKF